MTARQPALKSFFRAIDPRGLSVAGAALSPSEPHGINKEAEREVGDDWGGEGGREVPSWEKEGASRRMKIDCVGYKRREVGGDEGV